MESLGIIGFIFGVGAMAMLVQLKKTVEILQKDVEELKNNAKN
jgi:hypothetical protein